VAVGKRLIESRPFLTRIPDDGVIVTGRVPTSVPGAGTRRFAATRDTEGTYIMVYAPLGRSVTVDTSKIKGSKITAWLFNPRTGEAIKAGEFPNGGPRDFQPPDRGELLDSVLVFDDAAQKYPPPGATKTK
jgi:hypothetical protein